MTAHHKSTFSWLPSGCLSLLIPAPIGRSFSSSAGHLRAYEVWTALAISHGFEPKEVMAATAQGPYVVVDPDEPSTLLALSPTAFQKLKGQCVSAERSLVLLFSPLDEVKPTSASSGDPQNSPQYMRFGDRLSAPVASKTREFGLR